jgi:putative addiction module component (TIGR02574 family)
MAYDLSEIKKLSTEEKLQIIDELWETIESNDENMEEAFDEDPEVTALLQERIEKYERGEGVFYSWEEAKKIINQRLEDFRKIKND